jgi:predicted DNA-binding transcriptional regulator AlpA
LFSHSGKAHRFFILAVTFPQTEVTMSQASSTGTLDPYQVLPFREWIKLAGISRSTGWRILHDGTGPKILKLSERRYGVRVIDHIRWTDRLARKAGWGNDHDDDPYKIRGGQARARRGPLGR